jgi:phage terminase small subunit
VWQFGLPPGIEDHLRLARDGRLELLMAKAAKKQAAKKKPEPRKLTDKQAMFAAEYLVDLNASAAAIRAGFAKKTAGQQGWQLLQNTLVRDEIDRLKAARTESLKVDATKLLRQLEEELDADLADVYFEDGTLKPVHEWPMVFRKGLVVGIEVEEIFEGRGKDRVKVGEFKKLKFADRFRVKELIGKHRDVMAWKERREIGVDQPLKELLREISGQTIAPKVQQTGAATIMPKPETAGGT